MAHKNNLNGAHVVVFGGTSGMGFAIANMALSNGATVTISGSTQPKVNIKVDLLRSYYPSLPADRVSGHAVDLLDMANLEANLTTMLDKTTNNGTKKIHHIAFLAGDFPAGGAPKITNVTVDTAMSMFRVRFIAPVIIAKLIANGNYMEKSSKSSLILTGGTNCAKPMPGWSIMAAGGAASEGLVRGLAVDLKPIRVNMVHPGAIRTELLEGMLQSIGPEATEKFQRDMSLLNEFGRPEDIAEAYGWLMKDRFADGSIVSSDGGRLLVSPP